MSSGISRMKWRGELSGRVCAACFKILATPTFGRHISVRLDFVFFFISTIINKNNNKLALKNVCHFHLSGISPTEFINVNLDVR